MKYLILTFNLGCLLYLQLSDFGLKDKPTCSDCRETKRKYCILPLWKRGSKLCLMVSVCHPSSLGCGGGSHTFLGRECPQGNALRVTGPAAWGARQQPQPPGNTETMPRAPPPHFHETPSQTLSPSALVSLQKNIWKVPGGKKHAGRGP